MERGALKQPELRFPLPETQPSRREGLFWIALSAAGLLVFALVIDVLDALPGSAFLPTEFESARLLANTLARTSVALISAVMAALFLAIPLTANMYTAQLVDMFVSSWRNRVILGLFVFSAGVSVWCSSLVSPESQPLGLLGFSLALVLLTLACLLPFLFGILRSLDPDNIIAEVARSVTAAMRPPQRGPLATAQFRLAARIRNLGNVLLRMVDRADRDTALAAVNAIEACLDHYGELKQELPPEWFRPDPRLFPGLSADALGFVRNDRTWVELELLRQLSRAYSAACSRAPDVVSALAETQRDLALAAERRGDWPVLELAARFFNNYLREGIRRGDLRAVYDVLYQVRLFAARLWPRDPSRVVRLAQHLDFYGALAARSGMPFAHDLVAYDLGAVLGEVAGTDRPEVEELLEAVLAIEVEERRTDQARLSAGMLRARLQLVGALEAAGRKELAERVEESLTGLPAQDLAAAGRALLSLKSPVFHEVTDRQRNIDWVPPARRARIQAALHRLGAG